MTFIKKQLSNLVGFFSGIINGLLGAGGGMLIVPVLKSKLPPAKAHATTVAVILPMCVVSSMLYIYDGRVSLSDAMPYIPFGVIGAVIGTALLPKLSGNQLRVIFSLFMIWAGIRMIMR